MDSTWNRKKYCISVNSTKDKRDFDEINIEKYGTIEKIYFFGIKNFDEIYKWFNQQFQFVEIVETRGC